MPLRKLSLRSNDGSWLCAEGGGGHELMANRPAQGPWETFMELPIPNSGSNYFMLFNPPWVWCAEGVEVVR